MSINWVMLSADKTRFTPLPGEQQLWTSPSPRIGLALRASGAVAGYPGRDALSLESGAGTLFLTNRRILYLPAHPTPQLQSFAAPLLNLHDSHVAVPWFGANTWTAAVQPVPGGNLTTTNASSASTNVLELKLAFKDGGAFDFHAAFERVRERVLQLVELARETGGASAGAAGSGVAVDVAAAASVHVDELPAYEAACAAPAPASALVPDVPDVPAVPAGSRCASAGTSSGRAGDAQSVAATGQGSFFSAQPDDASGSQVRARQTRTTPDVPTDAPPDYDELHRN